MALFWCTGSLIFYTSAKSTFTSLNWAGVKAFQLLNSLLWMLLLLQICTQLSLIWFIFGYIGHEKINSIMKSLVAVTEWLLCFCFSFYEAFQTMKTTDWMAHIHVHTYIIAKSSQKLTSVKQTEIENKSFLLTIPTVTYCLLVHQWRKQIFKQMRILQSSLHQVKPQSVWLVLSKHSLWLFYVLSFHKLSVQCRDRYLKTEAPMVFWKE